MMETKQLDDLNCFVINPEQRNEIFHFLIRILIISDKEQGFQKIAFSIIDQQSQLQYFNLIQREQESQEITELMVGKKKRDFQLILRELQNQEQIQFRNIKIISLLGISQCWMIREALNLKNRSVLIKLDQFQMDEILDNLKEIFWESRIDFKNEDQEKKYKSKSECEIDFQQDLNDKNFQDDADREIDQNNQCKSMIFLNQNQKQKNLNEQIQQQKQFTNKENQKEMQDEKESIMIKEYQPLSEFQKFEYNKEKKIYIFNDKDKILQVCISLLQDCLENSQENIEFQILRIENLKWSGYEIKIQYEKNQNKGFLDHLSGIKNKKLNKDILNLIKEITRAIGPRSLKVENEGLEQIIKIFIYQNLGILKKLDDKQQKEIKKDQDSQNQIKNLRESENQLTKNSFQVGNVYYKVKNQSNQQFIQDDKDGNLSDYLGNVFSSQNIRQRVSSQFLMKQQQIQNPKRRVSLLNQQNYNQNNFWSQLNIDSQLNSPVAPQIKNSPQSIKNQQQQNKNYFNFNQNISSDELQNSSSQQQERLQKQKYNSHSPKLDEIQSNQYNQKFIDNKKQFLSDESSPKINKEKQFQKQIIESDYINESQEVMIKRKFYEMDNKILEQSEKEKSDIVVRSENQKSDLQNKKSDSKIIQFSDSEIRIQLEKSEMEFKIKNLDSYDQQPIPESSANRHQNIFRIQDYQIPFNNCFQNETQK